MEREYLSIDRYLEESTNKDNKENVLATFFQKRNYEPKTEQEKAMLDNFSFVAASMSLLIHIAMKKGFIAAIEREEIINRMLFELRQRPFERPNYTESSGQAGHKIIENLMEKLLDEYQNNQIHIDKQLELINIVYQNNPQKRYFIVRLFFYIAFADKTLDIPESEIINELSLKINVDKENVERIKKEVLHELKL